MMSIYSFTSVFTVHIDLHVVLFHYLSHYLNCIIVGLGFKNRTDLKSLRKKKKKGNHLLCFLPAFSLTPQARINFGFSLFFSVIEQIPKHYNELIPPFLDSMIQLLFVDPTPCDTK